MRTPIIYRGGPLHGRISELQNVELGDPLPDRLRIPGLEMPTYLPTYLNSGEVEGWTAHREGPGPVPEHLTYWRDSIRAQSRYLIMRAVYVWHGWERRDPRHRDLAECPVCRQA